MFPPYSWCNHGGWYKSTIERIKTVQKRDRLEPRIMGTNWHYKGTDLAKSILRMKGSKCGSPLSWFERSPSAKIWKDRGKLWWSAANFNLPIGWMGANNESWERSKIGLPDADVFIALTQVLLHIERVIAWEKRCLLDRKSCGCRLR